MSLGDIHCHNEESGGCKIWRCAQEYRIDNKGVPLAEQTSHLLIFVIVVGFQTRNVLAKSHGYNPGHLSVAQTLDIAGRAQVLRGAASAETRSYIDFVLRIPVDNPGVHDPGQGKH